jgi:uncharacterized protein YdaT
MPWTVTKYPPAMKNLPRPVRNKAIEIANALLMGKNIEEGIIIATAISRAKDWAKNRDISTKPKGSSRQTDVKQHGQDRYVVPQGNDGWAVRKEKSRTKEVFDNKEQAIKKAKKEAMHFNASVTIQRKNGKIEKRQSYNPNKKRKTRSAS